MANLTPDIGATGTFKLAEPFASLLTDGVAYTCRAVRTLADVTTDGKDPYTVYYQPQSIDQTKFAADAAADVNIVSLQSSSGVMVYVPSSYILSFPSTGGIPYTTMSLAATLSAIPDSVDLTALKNQMLALIKDTLGIDATIYEVQLSASQLISATQHKTYEAARQANITNRTTNASKLIDAQKQLQDAQTQIAQLQAYIKAHMQPSTTGS